MTIVKIWIAVTGGVIFSLATCLLALLLQENPVNLVHMSPSAEILFSVLGLDLLLTLYFLWIILAYLYHEGRIDKRFV
jgi:multisubunit Na+/H+ antiporter MnhB subunit